ncbi:hypothetical protein QOT17_015955 [Balamuthia mandrillaris]
MGNNECRLLGVSSERTIDVSLFLALWKTYRHLGEDGTRYLSRGNAKKFMKDLAAAWDIPYCPQTAECILARVAPQKTARLGFHAFKHLFAEAFDKALVAPNTRISSRNLSPELRQQLPQLRPEDWTALPIEVWCHVVSFLDRKSSSNLSLSCSLLRDVCISTQTRFSVSPFCLPHYGAMSSVLQRLVQNCPRLRHLSLRGCMFLNDEDLKLLPDTLLTLDLSHCQTITGNALRYIPPQLSCLSLAHCYGLRSLDLIFLPRRVNNFKLFSPSTTAQCNPNLMLCVLFSQLQKLNIAGFVLENGW